MTNLTDRRPLPKDVATMRAHYLPPEPTDTTVTGLRRAIRRIDTARVALQAAAQRSIELDRVIVADLVAAAEADEHFDEMVAALDPGDRAALSHQLEQLIAARALANTRLQRAKLTDPTHVAWVTECQRIEQEWSTAMHTAEDQSARFDALVRFAERHRRIDE